jgi:DNA-binding NarL/FixJ family response regulator
MTVTACDNGTTRSEPSLGAGATEESRALDACRVAIVDDQPITRAGMERLVSDEPHFTVVASVESVDQIGVLEGPGSYHVAIIALPGRGLGYLDAITSIAKVAYPVVTSTWDTANMLAHAIQAGARGCVTRHSGHQELIAALRIVAAGGFYVCPELVEDLQLEFGRPARKNSVVLAPREIETVRWIAMGFTQSQIATRMGLSQATVNTYAKRIRSKLQANNKAELTRIAIKLGYLDDDRRRAA